MKILVIDDELLVRRSIQRVCEKRGHEVKEAEDGEVGLQVWQEWAPELVFLDVLMPKMGGLELLRQFSNRPPNVVVLMSAYTGSIDMTRELSERADLFVPKPFRDIFEFVDQAEELVRARRQF